MTTYFIFGLGPRLADYQQDGVGSAHPRQILYTTLKNKNSCQTTIKGKLHKKYLWKSEDMEKTTPTPNLKTHPPRKINFLKNFF